MRTNAYYRLTLSALLLTTAYSLSADAPDGYYDRAEGLNQGALLQALEDIVGSHTELSYDDLWYLYKESDVRDDGTIWDMYATTRFKPGTDQCGSYSNIGDCYNREHSMPKSWFNKQSPMYTDAFHLYPTDGRVNGQRSNHPFGECANGSYVPSSGSNRALGRLGRSTFPGYSGTVFEPDDEYKGDFARTYFYMAAAYNSRISSWQYNDGARAQLAGNSYPCFSSWSVEMFMQWHREDPVSEKEINRNEVVYEWQHNRNPFIDHPELAEYIWGDRKGEGWVPGGGTTEPQITQPSQGEVVDLGITSVGQPVSTKVTIKGRNLTQNLTVSMTGDAGFTKSATTITAAEANAGKELTIRFTSEQAGSYTTSVTVSSSETSVTFTATAEAVNGIPALPATNITKNSFTARWKCIDPVSTRYSLSVFNADNSLLAGYPVQVTAGDESYTVTGLDYNTTYHYSLSGGSSTEPSNTVSVTTADVDHILQFESSVLLQFSSAPGTPSEPQQVDVYTENIYDPITVKVTGNFEIALTPGSYASEITLDPDGESFYVRMKATASEGSYSGTLSMSSGPYEGNEVDLKGTVAAPRTFFEDFEWTDVPGSYWSGEFDGNACLWEISGMYFAEVSSQDRGHDDYCARLRLSKGGSLEMAEDKYNGAGTVSFYGATFGTDENGDVTLSYSTNGGSSWTKANTYTLNNSLKEYSTQLNVKGNIRIRLEQVSGDRVNIDDISITDYTGTTSVESLTDGGRTWDAFATSAGRLTLTASQPCVIEIYNIDARQVYGGNVSGSATVELDRGIYIVVCGNQSKKVIVK